MVWLVYLRQVFVGVVALLLAGCGGGSGGGSNGQSPTDPAPVAPSAPLAIVNSTTVHDAAILGIGIPAFLVQALLGATYNLTSMWGTSLDVLEQTADCASLSPGNVTVRVLDRDNSGRLSDGDQVVVTYAGHCHDLIFGDLMSGEMTLELDRVVLQQHADLQLEGRLVISQPLRQTEAKWDEFGQLDPDYIIENSGSFSFRLGNGSVSGAERIEILSDAGDFLTSALIHPASLVERVREFEVIRNIAAAASPFQNRQFSLQFSHVFDSELLKGRLSCRTVAPFATDFADWPQSGAMECEGRNRTRVRLEAGRRDGMPEPAVLLDTGNGRFVSAGRPTDSDGEWMDYAEGAAFFRPSPVIFPGVWAERPPLEDDRPLVNSSSRSIPVHDAVYDAATNRVYISNAEGIVGLHAEDLETVVSIGIPAGEPGPLALSAESTRLWYGLQNRGQVGSLYTQTLELGPLVDLGQPRPGTDFNIRRAQALAVPPGSEDTVIVTMTSGEELIAYQDGAELPAGLLRTPGSPFLRIVMRDARSIVVMDDVGFGNVSRVHFEPDVGLTLERAIGGLVDARKSSMVLGNRYFFTDSGRVFDERAPRVVARLIANDVGNLDKVAVDRDTRTVYATALEVIRSTLLVYDEDTLALEGTYAFRRPEGQPLKLLVTPTALIVVGSAGLVRIARSDLAAVRPYETCEGSDLGVGPVTGRYVEISCSLNGAIYEPTLHRIYATAPSDAGPAGNTVVVIDPDTHTEVARLAVGSAPGRVIASPGGTWVYVLTPQASSIAVLDTGALALRTPLDLGFEVSEPTEDRRPRFADVMALSPTNAGDLIAGSRGSGTGFTLFQAGTAAQRAAPFTSDFYDVFLRSDGQRAVAHGPFRTQVMTVTADGLEVQSGDSLLLPDAPAGQRGDFVYSGSGPILDLETLSVRSGCPLREPVSGGASVAPDPFSQRVYYAFQRSTTTVDLQVCDAAEDAWLGRQAVQAQGSPFGTLLGLLTVGSDRLSLVFADRIVLIDRPVL